MNCKLANCSQVQDFRRNMLDVCENAVNERTSDEATMVLYNYPPNLVAMGGNNEIDGVDIINVTVCCFNTAGKQLQTILKVGISQHHFSLHCYCGELPCLYKIYTICLLPMSVCG